jgi:hypothetical protein
MYSQLNLGSEKISKMPGNGKKKESTKIQVLNISPAHRQDLETFYSNFASVNHTPEDISIDFCLITHPYKIDAEKKSIEAPIVTKVIMPIKMVEGLIKALTEQVRKYKEELNDIESASKADQR